MRLWNHVNTLSLNNLESDWHLEMFFNEIILLGNLQNRKISNSIIPSAFITWHTVIPSWVTALSCWRGLHNSVKLWALPCRVTQDGRIIVKSYDKTWSTGDRNGNPLQYSCQETPWTVWKDRELWYHMMNLPGWKVSNMSLGWMEVAGPKQKWRLILDESNESPML